MEEKAGRRIAGGKRLFIGLCLLMAGAEAQAGTPVLVYHRFGAVVADRMTVTTRVFEEELRHLQRRAD